MWILFGSISIITAILNLIFTFKNKNASWFRFISISFTALTLCAFYNLDKEFVLKENWVALMDVVPTLSKTLWILTIASILINSISLFKTSNK